MRQQRRKEGNVGDDAANISFLKPAIKPLDRGIAGRRPRDDLGEHGVVVRRYRIALAVTGIDAQPVRLVRRAPGSDAADRWHEILVWIFRIDPRLDGVAVELDLILVERQLFAERDAQLPFHEVDARDQLSHGMLDLKAGIHLDEEDVLAVGDELDGAGTSIVHRGSRLARGGAYRLALRGIEGRRRRFLDDLLVPPLQGAFTLEQRQQVAMTVADDLHLDVARVFDEFFDQQAVVAERRLGLAPGACDRRGKLIGRTHDAHATPAATRRRLDQNGKTDLVGGLGERRLVLGLAVIAGHQRHAGLFHQHFRARFRAHCGHHGSAGTDEYQSGIGASLREFGILRKESIARMHGFRAAPARCVNDTLDVQITVACPRRSEQHGRVRHGDMHGVAVGLGINRNRAQPHRFCGTYHAAGDLAAIGDQEGAKSPVRLGAIHRHILNRPKRVGSIWALVAAERPRPSTSRVSAGSITPSSHSRAVA